AIAYAFRLGVGDTQRRVLCPDCCGDDAPLVAREVRDTDGDRERFGVPTDDGRAIICHECGERLDGCVFLRVDPAEIAVLRFALDHAVSSTSEAHAEDLAQLRALIARLEAAQKSRARR